MDRFPTQERTDHFVVRRIDWDGIDIRNGDLTDGRAWRGKDL